MIITKTAINTEIFLIHKSNPKITKIHLGHCVFGEQYILHDTY